MLARSDLEDFAIILDKSRKPIGRSNLRTYSALSYEKVKKYIETLVQYGLLEEVSNEQHGLRNFITYRATPRGMKFLEHYNEIARLLGQKVFENFI